MKKIFVFMLAVIMCLSLTACGDTATEVQTTEPPITTTEAQTTEPPVTTEETKPNYAEIIPDELQGVWGDTGVEGILTLYAFMGNEVETYVVNIGIGAASLLSGTYTVEDGKITHDFENSKGYSNFTYDNNTLTMSNAENGEIKKLSSADIMEYLTQEENSANNNGVICLADLIIKPELFTAMP